MGFQFAETMAGTIEWDADPGIRHPFSFDITATADSLQGHLATGEARIEGVVHAPPFANAIPGQGLITIRPLGRRFIRYHLAFGNFELRGEKTIRWLAPRESFTHLPAEITDRDGKHVAHCETYFDVKDLWKFARSFHRV